MFKVEMLPALHGDALWIEYGDKSRPSRVLIDGGLSGTYDVITARAGKKCELELMCITHIDQDHIEGSVKLLANLPKGMSLKEVWYNGYDQVSQATRLGAAQGEKLGAAIVNHAKAPWNSKFDGEAVAVPGRGDLPQRVFDGGLTITILSPGKAQLTKLKPVWERECAKAGLIPGSLETAESALEADRKLRPRRLGGKLDVETLAGEKFKSDTAPANGSSIAFLAEFDGKSVLFAADAHSPVLEAGIQRLLAQRNQTRLKLDAFKVSHHGSKFNNSHALIGLLDCAAYLFSSNGDKFNHPDPETIARVLKAREGQQTHLWFNYRSEENKVWDVAGLKKLWKYKTHYPKTETGGIEVEL
jgi:beta-lactamase superfamily II metal-dependent hydrolase